MIILSTFLQILHIDGGKGQNMRQTKFHSVMDLEANEIIIQKTTIETLLGTHVVCQ